MAFIGTPLDTRNTFQSLQGKRFNGDGSETDFTLDVAPSSVLDIEVFVGNVRQDPNSAYTLSGTTLTFTGAPPSGTNNIYVVHQAKSVGTIDPPATETIAKTFSGATTVSGALVASSTTLVDTLGVKTAKDLGVGIHIRTADSGASVDGGGDELVIENSGGAGISILTGNDQLGRVIFGDAQDNGVGMVEYNHDGNVMKLNTAGSTGLQIDGNGHVTKPKQPCFFVYADSQSGVGSGTTDIPFANERFDLNADFSTPSFTAPVTGKYAFQMSVRIVNCQAGGNGSVYFQVSNAEIRAWRQDTDGDAGVYETASASVVIDMDANDTCKLQVNSSSDSDFIIDGGTHSTYFSGYLVA